ncbi:MAG: TIGR04133 family radical SAM/SPASM protein [Bacteroidales bacterium]|nr:TIGR04133 family radical SAM/SPASM protein [Bacteroidales bacterium]
MSGTPIRDFLHRRFHDMEARVHELNYLFWECTTRCNLHCRHCGSDCTAPGSEPDMPLEDFLRAFDTIPEQARVPGFTVVVTGGEPLLRPDLCDLGVALKKRHVGWGIVSNGWLYDHEMHRRLMGAGMGALTISLDGLEAEHDWMRGREGSFTRTLEAIAIAAREPRLNFDVVTCVNQRNLPQLQAIHDRLAALGVPQWRLFTIIPIGRAVGQPELHLSDGQFCQLMDFIEEKRTSNAHVTSQARNRAFMNVTFSCEGYLGRYERRVRQNPFFCHAGINIASVLIDGTICACPNVDRQAFAQGNIYQDSLWEVWQTRFQPFRDRRWARRGMCKDCRKFRDCLGGGMHNWHGDCREVINCHYHKTLPAG